MNCLCYIPDTKDVKVQRYNQPSHARSMCKVTYANVFTLGYVSVHCVLEGRQ